MGSSTCVQLLPRQGELREAIQEARQRDLTLELVTPLCSDEETLRVARLMRIVREAELAVDLVFNDWGLLDRYSKDQDKFQLVAGRLLNHQFKDPRVVSADPDRLGRPPATWRLGAATSPSWQALVREIGVSRVELDWPLHGLDTDAWSRTSLALSLHLPRVLVASGRTCVLRDPGGAVDRRERGERCERECEGVEFELGPAPEEGGPRRLRRGNCDLVELDRAARNAALAWTDTPGGPDRIVLSSEGPRR